MFIDTHAHLDFSDFDIDRNEVIERAKAEGIDYIINIGSSLERSIKSLELAKAYDFIYAAVGIHPHDADSFNAQIKNNLEALAGGGKVVAIGEIGLDYFKNYSKAENQKTLFKSLLKLACDSGLPAVIHSRNAQKDTLEIIKNSLPEKTVVHCFSGDGDFLKECLSLGFFVSFTCNITYKNALALRGLVKEVPLSRLLLETDAPFLPPQEFRGKRCEPLYVKYLAKEIAVIKGISIEEVARVTTANAKEFFNLR